MSCQNGVAGLRLLTQERTGMAGTGTFWGNNQRTLETSDEKLSISGKTFRFILRHDIAKSPIALENIRGVD